MRSFTFDQIEGGILVGSASLVQLCLVIYFYRVWGDKRTLYFGLMALFSGLISGSANLGLIAASPAICLPVHVISSIAYQLNGWTPRIMYGTLIESLMRPFVNGLIPRLLLKSYLMAVVFVPLTASSPVYDFTTSTAYAEMPLTHACPFVGTDYPTSLKTVVTSLMAVFIVDVWQIVLFVVAVHKLRLQRTKSAALMTLIGAFSFLALSNITVATCVFYLPNNTSAIGSVNTVIATGACLFRECKKVISSRVGRVWTYFYQLEESKVSKYIAINLVDQNAMTKQPEGDERGMQSKVKSLEVE